MPRKWLNLNTCEQSVISPAPFTAPAFAILWTRWRANMKNFEGIFPFSTNLTLSLLLGAMEVRVGRPRSRFSRVLADKESLSSYTDNSTSLCAIDIIHAAEALLPRCWLTFQHFDQAPADPPSSVLLPVSCFPKTQLVPVAIRSLFNKNRAV